MRILVIGDGGWLGRHSWYTVRALHQLGHDIETLWLDRRLPGKLGYLQARVSSPESRYVLLEAVLKLLHKRYSRYSNHQVRKQIASFQATAILVLNGRQILPETWRQLREQGTILINWIADDPFRFPQLLESLPYFNIVFVTDPVHLTPLRFLLPQTVVDVLPLAADPEFFKPQELTEQERTHYGCDLLFVGTGYGGDAAGRLRGHVVASLAEDYDVKLFGNGWDNLFEEFPALASRFHGPIRSAEELNKAYNAAKLVLVVHHPQCKLQTNQGPYEVSCAGGFTVAEKKQEITEVFGDNIPCFESVEQAKELVAYYLDNATLRQSKAMQSQAIVLQGHTYLHRMQKLTDAIAECT